MTKKGMKYLIIIFILLIACIVTLIIMTSSNLPQSGVVVLEEESFYSDFTVENGKVYISCSVILQNTSDTVQRVWLRAAFPNDIATGLLTDEELYAKDNDEQLAVFTLSPNTKERFDVCFVGEFGGTAQKNDRLLPPITVFSEKKADSSGK